MTRVRAPTESRPGAASLVGALPVPMPGAAAAGSVVLPAPRREFTDVLFVVAVTLLLAVHLTIFIAVLVLAPVTPDEADSLRQVHLPLEVARALVLPFHAMLLVSLFVLGRRAAGRWAGFGAMLAVLSLNLRADPTAIVYGPSVATGGWIAAALLAAALALLPKQRLLAAGLLGAATVFHGLTVLALPPFLVAVALFPLPTAATRRGGAALRIGVFAAVWAVPAAVGQVLRLADLGGPDYAATFAPFVAEFRPHALVPLLEQQRLLFAAWHFPALLTFFLAMTLFTMAIVGVIRYFREPRPDEGEPSLIAVLRRLPIELWAAGLTLVTFATWWAFSGLHVILRPNLPALVAIAPLITASAYRGAKWMHTLRGFWPVISVVYLVGLVLARSTQLVLTLIQATQH